MRIGYARVSTVEQSLDLQRKALIRAGCDQIFQDLGISGQATDRKGLQLALRHLGQGDTLVVWRLDRLGRSLIHLIQLINELAARGAQFQSLNEAIDTNSSGGRLVFHMMGALAEFERTLISERTKAGMQVAKESGRRLGRPLALTPKQIEDARDAIAAGEGDIDDIAAVLGVHPRTLARALQRLDATE